MNEEQAEECPLPRGRHVNGPIAIDDPEWAQDLEMHGGRDLCSLGRS
jgi:hypothetical protein